MYWTTTYINHKNNWILYDTIPREFFFCSRTGFHSKMIPIPRPCLNYGENYTHCTQNRIQCTVTKWHNFVLPTLRHVSVLIIKPNRCTNFKFIFGIKLYMFRTVPLSIIRSSSLYTQQWYMSYRFADSLRAGSGQNWFCPDPARKLSAGLVCYVYSARLLMMDRGTVRNM